MPLCTLLVGPPGSGKSTRAHDLIHKDGDHEAATVRISQDDQGKQGHLDLFLQTVNNGQSIIIDRMNYNKQQRAVYIEWARAAGYDIRIELFCVPAEVCLNRCQDRKYHPTVKTMEDAYKAVAHFFRWYEKPTGDEGQVIVHSEVGRTPCIIVDLDGTLCNIDHRLHTVRGEGKKDWDAFFAGIPYDKLNTWCLDVMRGMAIQENTVILCSGRGNEYRSDTVKWLFQNNVSVWTHLFMRPEKNYQHDDAVKEMLLDFEILPRYKPVLVIDDRQQVVDMWRRRGITCLQCAPGQF